MEGDDEKPGKDIRNGMDEWTVKDVQPFSHRCSPRFRSCQSNLLARTKLAGDAFLRNSRVRLNLAVGMNANYTFCTNEVDRSLLKSPARFLTAEITGAISRIQVEYLNDYALLTAKPTMFAINLNLADFKRKKNKSSSLLLSVVVQRAGDSYPLFPPLPQKHSIFASRAPSVARDSHDSRCYILEDAELNPPPLA